MPDGSRNELEKIEKAPKNYVVIHCSKTRRVVKKNGLFDSTTGVDFGEMVFRGKLSPAECEKIDPNDRVFIFMEFNEIHEIFHLDELKAAIKNRGGMVFTHFRMKNFFKEFRSKVLAVKFYLTKDLIDSGAQATVS